MKHKALEKGLSALISEETKKALENEVIYLKIEEIRPNPYQPRKLGREDNWRRIVSKAIRSKNLILRDKEKEEDKKEEKDTFISDLEERLKSFLGTKVNILQKIKGRTIFIEYYSLLI